MNRTLLFALGIVAVFAVTSRPVLGHHGGAAFDQTKVTTLSGTVTELQFVNPHVVVVFDVDDGHGGVTHWSAWLTAPNKLQRAGWNKRTLQAGDHITVAGSAQKNGSPVLQVRKLTGPDGKDLPLSEN
jgi:hypothetical protein